MFTNLTVDWPRDGAGDIAVGDSYASSNRDADTALNNTTTAVGQSFTGNGQQLDAVQFVLSKSNSPTGNAVAKIYAHTGSFGTTGKPTGDALATSKAVDVSTLTGTPTLTTFSFPSDEVITLANGTRYFAVIEYSDGDASNTVDVGHDASSPSHGGNLATYAAAAWSADATKDGCFVIASAGVPLDVSGLDRLTFDVDINGNTITGQLQGCYSTSDGTTWTDINSVGADAGGDISAHYARVRIRLTAFTAGTGGEPRCEVNGNRI